MAGGWCISAICRIAANGVAVKSFRCVKLRSSYETNPDAKGTETKTLNIHDAFTIQPYETNPDAKGTET